VRWVTERRRRSSSARRPAAPLPPGQPTEKQKGSFKERVTEGKDPDHSTKPRDQSDGAQDSDNEVEAISGDIIGDGE
jgi:hypothetical protein